jgi:FAD/FMN-containing dehydrogenase
MASSKHDLVAALTDVVGARNVLLGADIGDHYRTDIINKYNCAPDCVVRPASTEEVSGIMKAAYAAGVPVTVIGGQTGTAGGAIASPGGIALSLERMNAIEEIDTVSMTMTVQAGCVLQIAQEAAEEKHAFLPLDIGARGSAMIGGVIGTNAGGNRVLRWGMTRDMVLGLEVVLADGAIVSSLTKMLKDNAGYSWKQLLIGSEGTLGVVTRAVLRLRPQPTSNQTALVATDSFDDAARLLRDLEVSLGGRLSSYELIWGDFYSAMTETQLSVRPRPLATGRAFYILLEMLGGDAEHDPAEFQRALEAAMESGLVVDAVIAQSDRERQGLWAVREDFAPFLANFKPFISYDVSMGLVDMPRFVGESQRRLATAFPGCQAMFYGHAGDGNLHILFHMGPDTAAREKEVDKVVYEVVRAVNGSIAAEHAVGVSRAQFLGMSRSDAELSLMRKIKDALDPKHILNPGKVLT